MLEEMSDQPLRPRLTAKEQTETEGVEESPCEGMGEVEGEGKTRAGGDNGAEEGREDGVRDEEGESEVGRPVLIFLQHARNLFAYHWCLPKEINVREDHRRPLQIPQRQLLD